MLFVEFNSFMKACQELAGTLAFARERAGDLRQLGRPVQIASNRHRHCANKIYLRSKVVELLKLSSAY